MKITIIGAGAIGSAIAHELSKRPEITQLQVCDARARSLQQLHEALPSAKLRSFQLDARDAGVLEPILKGSACVVSSAPSALNPILAELCLSLGSHFCDLGGDQKGVNKELQLAEKAREKSLWIVPNCGLAPGLVNILCLRGIEQFDEVEAAHLRVGDIPLNPEPPFNFRISWSAEKVLDDYTNPVQLIQDGTITEVEPLSHVEEIHFDPPFDPMEAFCTAGSPFTFIEEIAGRVKTLDHKTVRWPGHADQMCFLLGLGFGERRNIDVRTHLTYRDVLVRRMRQRLGGEHKDAVLIRVLVKGKRKRKKQTLVYEMVVRYDEEQHFSAMQQSTSIPTAVIAYLVATRQVKGGGAAPPERVVPKEQFCKLLAERGLVVNTKWYDGYRDVTDPEKS